MFLPVWWHFCPHCTPRAAFTTQFMVVFALRGFTINEKIEIHLWISRKKHIFTKIARTTKKKLAFFGWNFWTFWPLTGPRGPQTDIFCFHYLCREKTDQNDMSHSMLIPSIYIYFEEKQKKKKKKKKKKEKKEKKKKKKKAISAENSHFWECIPFSYILSFFLF